MSPECNHCGELKPDLSLTGKECHRRLNPEKQWEQPIFCQGTLVLTKTEKQLVRNIKQRENTAKLQEQRANAKKRATQKAYERSRRNQPPRHR